MGVNWREDPDDWFGGAAAEEEEDAARGYADDDWLHDGEGGAPRHGLAGIDRRFVVAAVAAVALLIAILAAAGVFSSGGNQATPAPDTVTTTATTAPVTTTTPPSAPVALPTANLKPGDEGAQVKLLQRALARLGYLSGKADGVYGPATEAATKRFQRSAGLTDDGIVGPATLRALERAVRAG